MCSTTSVANKCLFIFMTVLFLHAPIFSQTITFDDSDPDFMKIDNGSVYEITLFKQHGAFSYIKDKTANVKLTLGYNLDALWNALFANDTRLFSTDYSPNNPKKFDYSWDGNSNTLTLTYTPDFSTDPKVSATVTLTATTDSYFDMQITIDYEGDNPIKTVEFHSGLSMVLGTGDKAFVPILYPGLMLGSDFFAAREDMMYDGNYISYQIKGGSLSIYQLFEDSRIQVLELGLDAKQDVNIPHNYSHEWRYLTWIENGTTWTSPVSRFRVGQSPKQSLDAYREDNGIDLYPSVQAKQNDKFEVFAKSPLFYYAFPQYQPPRFLFTDVSSQIEAYPSPAIIMFSMYYLSGFPGYSPDYLPPVSFLGTTEDFQNLVSQIHSLDQNVMLFTIPSWWHANSPTILKLSGGVAIEDIAVIDLNGIPHLEDHFGDQYYWVSPSSPFVQQKFDEIYTNIFDVYGADIIYEDAMGGGGVPYDFNINSDSPTSDRKKWVEYYEERSDHLIVTEGNSEQANEFIAGIFGTSYGELLGSGKGWNYNTDDGYWRFFPAISFLFNDKVIYYNLWPTQATQKDVIAWSMLFSCPLNLVLDAMTSLPPENLDYGHWIPVIHDFQTCVISRTYGKLMTDYNDLTGAATQADYGDITVIRNWDETNAYVIGENSIASMGALLTSVSGDLTAGILNRYNGADLTSGDHYLVVQTWEDSIVVRHPMGNDSPIQITRPSNWTNSSQIHVSAMCKTGSTEITPTINDKYIQFNMVRSLSGNTIIKFKIEYGATYVPDNNSQLPTKFALYQNYPNPFNNKTIIRYDVPRLGRIVLKIFNLSGQEIKTLKDENLEAGEFVVEWDGHNNNGSEVSSGLYIIEYINTDQRIVRKMLMLK